MPLINITSDNAKMFCKLLKNNTFICLYHWNMCGHCIELLPIWRSVIEKIGKNANIVEIELDNMKYLDAKYSKIQGFPTILVYKNGKKVSEFKQPRTYKNLEKFIKDNSVK
jgi:thioredoxin-like negative regulator of GroEL